MSEGTPAQAAYEELAQRIDGIAAKYEAELSEPLRDRVSLRLLADQARSHAALIREAGRADAAGRNEARADVRAMVADAVSDATHAYAKDEILANAGPEWDRPLAPETNAIEYVRHLESQVAGLRALAAEMCDDIEHVVIHGQPGYISRDMIRGYRERAGLED